MWWRRRLVERGGERRATRYRLSDSYALLHSVDVDAYFAREPDERAIQPTFNFELLREQLPTLQLFTDAEREQLTALQATYRSNVAQQDPNYLPKGGRAAGHRPELEVFPD